MEKSSKATLIGIVAGIAIALIGVFAYTAITGTGSSSGGTAVAPVAGTSSSSGTTANTTGDKKSPVVAPMEPIVRKTIKPAAIDRVFPRIIKGEFTIIGSGEDAKWGIGKTANFKYSLFIVAESEILSKKALPDGNIKVEEMRTFKRVQDSMVVSDVDFKFVFDTLPMDTFSKAIDAAVVGWTSLTADVATAAIVLSSKKYVEQKLKEVDGIGARKLLGLAGFQPTVEVDEMMNKLASSHVKKALGGIRSISGKSYKITYYQEKSGQPMLMTFTNKDGSQVTDEEELMVLKRVNTFIDYNMVPNTECRPGESWTVDAEDMQEVFDPFVEGRYNGNVKVTRMSNDDKGNWVLAMSPSVINVVGDSGSTTGSLQLQNGSAQINPALVSINELKIAGKAKLSKLSKHHWLFTAKISGWCDFQGRVITVVKE